MRPPAADTAAAAASKDDVSCMQAHPHSESKLDAGTIAAASACCYVCQHIDLSRAIEALMLMLTVLRIRVVVEVENKSRCRRRRREPPPPRAAAASDTASPQPHLCDHLENCEYGMVSTYIRRWISSDPSRHMSCQDLTHARDLLHMTGYRDGVFFCLLE